MDPETLASIASPALVVATALLGVGMLSVLMVLLWLVRAVWELCRLARLLEIRVVQLLLISECQPRARRELAEELRELVGRNSFF